MTDILPKQTLYIRNLYEKISATELKKCLYCLFTQFGKIAHIQCVKTNKLRGQAWIIFADVNSATNALQCMNGFPFFEKNIEIQYAKDESTALRKTTDGWKSSKRQKTEAKQAKAAAAAAAAVENVPAQAAPQTAQPQVDANPPNKLLFVEGLPPNATSEMLKLIFNQLLGLVEVRMVDARPGIAFVEYDAEGSATNALQTLQNFSLGGGHNMRISYAK